MAKAAAPGTILIRGITTRCIIGVRAWERRRKQRVIIDVELDADFAPAAASDDLRQAVDYKRIKDDILSHVMASRYQLLESLAESIASHALSDARVSRVLVTVDKPGALRHARSVGVRVERTR